MGTALDRFFASPYDVVRYCATHELGVDAASGPYLGSYGKLPLFMRSVASSMVLDAQPERRRCVNLVPSVVLDRDTSLVVIDLDRSVFTACGGARAQVGPVFQLDWSARDGRPDRPGPSYPSWNPLADGWLCPYGGRRDMQLRIMARHLVRHAGVGADAVACLELAFQWMLAQRVALRDPLTAVLVPEVPAYWLHVEPNLPMAYDWLAGLDANHRALLEAADQIRRLYDFGTGYNPFRLPWEILSRIARMAPEKRRAAIEAARASLAFCEDPGIRERLAASSFAAAELRGMPEPAARIREERKMAEELRRGRRYAPRYAPNEMRPITVFVGAAETAFGATAVLTSLFVEMSAFALMGERPNTIDARGRQFGPHDVLLHIDGADRLPTIETLTHVPTAGRCMHLAMTLYADTLTTLRGRYRAPDLETMAKGMDAVVLAGDTPAGDLRRFLGAGEGRLKLAPEARAIVIRARSDEVKPILAAERPWWAMTTCRNRAYRPDTETGVAPPRPCPLAARA